VTRALVAGALANKPGNGGAAWTRLSWVLGLRAIGLEVHLVEQLDRFDEGAPVAARWFRDVTARFGLTGWATLLGPDGGTIIGLSRADLVELAADAELLVNLSGHLKVREITERVGTRVFVDLDPGYTQLWDHGGVASLGPHEHWYTVGSQVGRPGCELPTGGRRWRPVRQPVLLDEWPVLPPPECGAFTTVASWRGPFGPVLHRDRWLGGKAPELRALTTLPSLVEVPVEVALQIDEADDADGAALRLAGWRVVEAGAVAGDPDAFRRYVQHSAGELSVAQSVYVHARTGWFGDRSTRYLATGRPVVVQDTGFSDDLPVGEGLLCFTDLHGAAAALEDVAEDPERHARAARRIAEEHFDARLVLSSLCEEVDVAP